MKQPEMGELWLDLPAWKASGKPRLLLIEEILSDAKVAATAIQGGQPGPRGIPLKYFQTGMVWQGYWSKKHQLLPRMGPPFSGSPLQQIAKSSNAARLNGRVELGNSIIPSFRPSEANGFDAARNLVAGVSLDKPVSAIPAGVPYLRLKYSRSLFGGTVQKPPSLFELWYQKQQGAWWLVRTLVLYPLAVD